MHAVELCTYKAPKGGCKVLVAMNCALPCVLQASQERAVCSKTEGARPQPPFSEGQLLMQWSSVHRRHMREGADCWWL